MPRSWPRICAATRAQTSGHGLLLGDTTEVEFGIHRAVERLGPTGDGGGRGFFLHSSLMVSAEGEELVGLAGQALFYREPIPPGESRYDRVQRKRERQYHAAPRLEAIVGFLSILFNQPPSFVIFHDPPGGLESLHRVRGVEHPGRFATSIDIWQAWVDSSVARATASPAG